MCANPQSNWLNTIAVRASYILPGARHLQPSIAPVTAFSQTSLFLV